MDECICCGATVPEGRQVCLICEKRRGDEVAEKEKTCLCCWAISF